LSIVNDVDEDATESINSVNLSCLFQPASVRGCIGNYYSKIILDTGASLSVIKTDVAKGLFSEWKSKCESYTSKSIVPAAEHTLNTHGWLTFPVKIRNCTLQVKAIVADNLPHPILLGNDTIVQYNMDILLSKQLLVMGSMQIPISVKHSPVESGMITANFSIPAEHAAIIWITFPKTDTTTEWVVKDIDKSVMIAHTLVSDDGK
jgi:hypothetical protein